MYAFTDDLKTGNTMIDQQHEQLFIAINNLLEACAQGKGRDEIEKTLKFLHDYTVKHFSDEEKLQQQYQYPDYPNHKQYHTGFTKVIRDMMTELQQEGPTVTLVHKVNQNVASWLIVHIKREDVKLAQHIRQKQGAAQ